jgi:xanthine dehydrogenase YagT iron-sulfur-binding subunit
MSSPSIRESDASIKANAPDAAAKAAKQDLGKLSVSPTVNGQTRALTIEPRTTLLDALREELALTGTKKGCDRGECGASMLVASDPFLHDACAMPPRAALAS